MGEPADVQAASPRERIEKAGELVTPKGEATQTLADQWKVAGSIPNLWAGSVIADATGRPTPGFIQSWRAAWGYCNELDRTEILFAAGRFTSLGLARWSASVKR
jgi:hypothetical protein